MGPTLWKPGLTGYFFVVPEKGYPPLLNEDPTELHSDLRLDWKRRRNVEQIFVSYNHQVQQVAQSVAADLEAIGHDVWLDEELSGGQSWWDQILERVRRCDIFVFILEPASLESAACQREYEYASALGKPILPLLVSDDVSINLLPPALTEIQFVDYRTPDRDSAFRLARAMAVAPPAGPLPDPLPEAPAVPLSYLGGLAQQVDTSSTLSYEEQSGLLVDLKRGLRDPETEADARILLLRLRNRRDLLASIAFEIDDLTQVVEDPPPPEDLLLPTPENGELPGADIPRHQSSPTEPATRLAGAKPRESFSSVVARLRGKNPPGEPSPLVAMVLQVIAGAGLLYARRDLRRRWLYPVALAAIGLFLVLFIPYDLEHEWPLFTESEFDGTLVTVGLVVYAIGLADAFISCVIRRPTANVTRT